MKTLGEQCTVRLELRPDVTQNLGPAERADVDAWLRDCERVLQEEADRTFVQTSLDGSISAFIRKPDGQ